MRYIDKNKHLQEGHDITDRYLETVCRVDDGGGNYHYQNVDFEGSFASTNAKSDMQYLTMKSQENLCCYCMRDLHMQKQRITLEHIIPQRAGQLEYRYYTGMDVFPLTVTEVILTDDFSGPPNVTYPPRPHTVTFENLVASCNGTFPDKDGAAQCCNHRRGQRHIYPLFYISGIENEITYMEDGTMQPAVRCARQVEYRQTIDSVRLNCQNLKDIRRLWHLLGNEDRDVLVACLNDRNLRNRKLMAVLSLDNRLIKQDINILNKFMKDEYWKTFLLYHWFHHRL